MRLEGKHALVTGGAEGIGAAVVRAFAREGASVLIADIQHEKAAALAKELEAQGGDIQALPCDVAKREDLERVFLRAIALFGRLHIVVNNAARAIGGVPITEFTEEDWELIVATNLASVFRMCRLAVAHMQENDGGCIVNIASTQAHVGFRGWSAYAAMKGGVLALSRQLAAEYASQKIRVNSVSPGAIETAMNRARFEAEGPAARRSAEALHPLGRLGGASEVAEAVLYLASEEASFTTGIDLRVDGGQTATSHDYLA
jgi:NAD(P)-dependent dehydrogenase (short-subunit alcohol dehydrogenase family)